MLISETEAFCTHELDKVAYAENFLQWKSINVRWRAIKLLSWDVDIWETTALPIISPRLTQHMRDLEVFIECQNFKSALIVG